MTGPGRGGGVRPDASVGPFAVEGSEEPLNLSVPARGAGRDLDVTVISITLGEIEEAVEASTVQAQHWVVERAADLVEGGPKVTTGEVRVRAER